MNLLKVFFRVFLGVMVAYLAFMPLLEYRLFGPDHNPENVKFYDVNFEKHYSHRRSLMYSRLKDKHNGRFYYVGRFPFEKLSSKQLSNLRVGLLRRPTLGSEIYDVVFLSGDGQVILNLKDGLKKEKRSDFISVRDMFLAYVFFVFVMFFLSRVKSK